MKEYLKAKIEELETNNKIKNIRDQYGGIMDFKKGYQPRTNKVKDVKANSVTDSQCFGQMDERFLSAVECTQG